MPTNSNLLGASGRSSEGGTLFWQSLFALTNRFFFSLEAKMGTMNFEESGNNSEDGSKTCEDAVAILEKIHGQGMKENGKPTNNTLAHKRRILQAGRNSLSGTTHRRTGNQSRPNNSNSNNNKTPGAHRVRSNSSLQDESESSLNDEHEATSAGDLAASLNLIEAQVVQEGTPEEDFECMLEQAREEGRKEAVGAVAVGVPVDANIVDEAVAKRKSQCIAAIFMVLLLVAVTLAVVLRRPSEQRLQAPTFAPSQQPVPSLVQDLLVFLERVPFVPTLLSYPATNVSSAEEKALAWMVDEDPLVPSLLRTADFDRLQQRFSLLCFAFSNPLYPFEAVELEEDECLWPHITCSNETRRVTSIKTNGNKLFGSLPEALGLLTDIRELELFASKLQGSLPLSLSQLTLLEEFVIDQGGLTGTFPWDSFRNMTNLVTLGISDHSFSGKLPTSVLLPKIESAYLQRNGFTGTLPSELARWSSLQQFSVSSNLLSGTIPSHYEAWTNIRGFYVADISDLSGLLPASFGDWNQIEAFDVSYTGVSGEIPQTYANWRLTRGGQFQGTQLIGSMPLCDLNQTIPLIADCLNVSCPCCDYCCQSSIGNIPLFPYC